MRILCLHGQGASATIFEAQLSRLVAALPSHWTFEFFDAPIQCGPGLDLGHVYPGPYYCFFESYTPDRMADAVDYVREIVEDEGPFGAVIGFSQGASVAAAYLSTYAAKEHTSTFAFATFICTALIPPALASKTDTLEANVGTLISNPGLSLPTVHIMGTKDPCFGQSIKLLKGCESEATSVGSQPSTADSTPSEPAAELDNYFPTGLAQALYFPGGHDVPRDSSMVTKMQSAIENAARLAFLG